MGHAVLLFAQALQLGWPLQLNMLQFHVFSSETSCVLKVVYATPTMFPQDGRHLRNCSAVVDTPFDWHLC